MTPIRNLRGLTLIAASLVIAVLFTFFILTRLFGGATLSETLANIGASPDAPGLLFVNALVGISVALFVIQLRWNALRVVITVIVALIIGYGVTALFNLDSAARFTRGEFKVTLISDAEAVENDQVDLQYGRSRGDEFNKPGAREPVTQAAYTFEGKSGDVVSILGIAANRRSEIDMQLALLDPVGETLASATTVTPELIERFKDDDVRTERDAVIADFTLPADGVYTIVAEPQPVPGDVTVNETVSATNLAYDAFLLGPLGRVNRWAVWIQDALTLILIGLAIAIVFRAQQFALGAEGQLYFGALVSGAIALSSSNLPPILVIPLALLGAVTAGFLWGLLPGILKAYLGANELLATLMLNTIATRFYELVLTFQLKPPDAGYTASDDFPVAAQFPQIVSGTQVTVAIFLVIAAVVIVWLLINRTPLGYEIRMVGANRKFADYGGVNTKRTIMLAMAVSGLVAGLAGAHLSMGIHRMLILNISLGLAFEGIVVALLARNDPLVIPFTGLLYSYLRAGAQFMERDANVSFEVVRIIQAIIILLITAEALIAFFQNRRAMQRAIKAEEAAAPAGAASAQENKAHV
ncbi:MAG: ABC transporter permease [Anaerolineae bacterium]|nr:ABC transporter permease [Anaerolineae bacterium]